MILKGQNFRILTRTSDDWSVVGMATNCTIILTNNTEDASTKDDIGLASKPTMTSQGWTVQVDSLDVSDTAAMLTAIALLTPFHLLWDETSTTDNQTAQIATFNMSGDAYLTDCTFNFDDRTNSQKQLQFTGVGEIQKLIGEHTTVPVASGSLTKGQFVRLFISSDNTTAPTGVIASAKTLSLHVSLQLEDATTKDTPGNWQIQEPTGLSYDISTSALVRGADVITSSVPGKDLAAIEAIFKAGTPVKWKIANTSGDNQRTASSTIISGSCLITNLTLNGPNKQAASYNASLAGYGSYEVAS